MVGCGPSTSGRVCCGLTNAEHLSRQLTLSPRHHELRRLGNRQRAVTCQAIALPNRLQSPFIRALIAHFRPPQDGTAEDMLVPVSIRQEQSESRNTNLLNSLLKQATYAAVHVGLRLTGLAIQLAKSVAADVKRTVRFVQEQHQVQLEAAAARKAMDAEIAQQQALQRDTLRRQGKDTGFMHMLHILDRCHLDHDVKWALVQKHTADKAEFCERLQHLYRAAEASKEAVETLLRPDASRREINTFWKSKETAALIAEEDALKQLVFAQMLQAGIA